MTVDLLRRPDPAEPSRNEEVIGTEGFRNLSLDPRHSRYAPRIIGDVAAPLRREDRRPEGESLYIRLSDRAATPAELRSIRIGPETLVDHLPNGPFRAGAAGTRRRRRWHGRHHRRRLYRR